MGVLRIMGAKPQPHERIVQSGKVVTCAGVSAGIDLGLWLAGKIAGREQAEAIQLSIEYDPRPPFDAGHIDKASKETRQAANEILDQRMPSAQRRLVPKIAWRRFIDLIRTGNSAVFHRRPGKINIVGSTRSVLINSSVALVEDWATYEVPLTRSAEDYSPRTQICFPYRGAFVWHVGGQDIVGDANQILFVPPGETFRVSQLHRDGCGELIVTPHPDVVAELVGSIERPCVHPLFRRRRRRADPAVQRASARFRQLVRGGELDELAADELLLDLVVSALQSCHGNEPLHPGTRRLVDRAKTFLGANFDCTLRLKDIAAAVGASAAYLTDAFRRAEGIPLHGYLVQLRLARALVEIPHSTDLTELALRLGFSSHSHFTAAFRKSFGCTPSDFRQSTRKTTVRCKTFAASSIETF